MKFIFILLYVLVSSSSYAQLDTLEQYFYASEHLYSMDITFKSGKQKTKYIYSEGPNNGKELSKKIVSKIEKAQTNPDIGSCTPCWLKTYNQNGIAYEGLFYTDCCVGEYVSYHSNGEVSEKGQFVPMENGELTENPCTRTGHWQFFDENGNLIKEEDYINGILQK